MVVETIHNPLRAAELVLLGVPLPLAMMMATPTPTLRIRVGARSAGKTWDELRARIEQAVVGGFA